MRLPNLNIPISTRKIPARIVAVAKPDIPLTATIPATIVANAAVGPAICTLDPPRKEIINPAIIAVYKPSCGPTPDARARAIDNGKARIATIIPDTTSVANCFLVYVFITENNFGFNLSMILYSLS
jgi:hypothetical protein